MIDHNLSDGCISRRHLHAGAVSGSLGGLTEAAYEGVIADIKKNGGIESTKAYRRLYGKPRSQWNALDRFLDILGLR